MGKIIGLGGPFIKAKDPKALARWYTEKLGVDFGGQVYATLPISGSEEASKGYNVLSFFKMDEPYFAPSKSNVMLNFRVSGLFELLEELKSKGVEVIGEPIDEEYGKFGWVLDLEGNKIELWEPPVS